jgi:flagellar hook assembly protein FlgD
MYLFNKTKLTKILLIVLFCCPFVFTQVTYIKVNHIDHHIAVPTNIFGIKVKAGYYNEELFNKLENPPYYPTYSFSVHMSADSQSRSIGFHINGDMENINILDHYYKFEKEEFVERVTIVQVVSGIYPAEFIDGIYEIKGQVLQNGEPLVNHIVNLFTTDNFVYNSITDKDGNYNFNEVGFRAGSHIVSTKIGNTRHENILLVEKKQYSSYIPDFVEIIDFSIGEIINTNEPAELPTGYNLSQNYPNPFNPTTTIKYSIPKDEFVKLTVYDITGRVVKELVNGYKSAGRYNVEFNASGYASGIYYYRIEAGQYNNVQKMMLIK